MVMMRHPLSRTEYHRNEDGTVRVVGRGLEGTFTRTGVWISGERRTADPSLCRWVADGTLREQVAPNSAGFRPRFDVAEDSNVDSAAQTDVKQDAGGKEDKDTGSATSFRYA